MVASLSSLFLFAALICKTVIDSTCPDPAVGFISCGLVAVTSDRRTGGIDIRKESYNYEVVNKFDRQITQYNECFDCGRFEHTVGATNAKLEFKLVRISIEMPARLDSIRGYSVALCPRCYDMMNTDDF